MEQMFFPVTRREAERSGIQYSSEKNKNAGFPSRLRKLRKEKGVSQDVVSKELGVSKSTLGLWETGDTLPDARAIFDLAIYYDVSTDYLLGKTDFSTSDMKTKEICEYTGLTQDTVSMLSVYATQGKVISSFLARFFEDIVAVNDETLDTINAFLVNAAHADAVYEVKHLVELDEDPGLAKGPSSDRVGVEIDNIIDSMNGTCSSDFKISALDAKWFYLTQAQDIAKKMIDIILEEMEDELKETFTSTGLVKQTPEKRIWRLIEDEQ